MSTPLESFHQPNRTQAAEHWESHAVDSAYGDKNPSVWTKLAGIGVLTASAVFVAATHGEGLKTLGQVIKAGASELPSKGASEAMGLSEELVKRICNIDHFVFDLDRTLIDFDKTFAPLRRTLSQELTMQSGLPSRFINKALDETQKRLDSPYFYNRLDEIRPLQERFPGVDLNEKFADASVKAKAAFYDALKPSPETIELLQYLKGEGKSIHLFSARSPTRTLAKLEGSGLIHYFDHIFTAGSNTFEDNVASKLLAPDAPLERVVQLTADAKSEGHGYHEISEYLRTHPNRMAMTGDSPELDIAPAKALGIFTAEARWYRNTPSATVLPDLELESPTQFTDTLKRAYGASVQT